MTVLLLNATYEPLAVISRQRALSLLMRGRVDVATDQTITVVGASTTFKIPTVLRLRRYVNAPSREARWSRKGVLRRDGYRCIYCGVQAGDVRDGRVLSKEDFGVDHLIPRSRGGKNTWGNTACACAACNHRKGGRTPHEAGMKLRWEPKTPRVNYLILSGEIPEAWKIYLRV
ncbi:MAG: HNH endonuclease [Caldilineales bacterium]|nr:HNH endonuclease [Caldilineales bacterium]